MGISSNAGEKDNVLDNMYIRSTRFSSGKARPKRNNFLPLTGLALTTLVSACDINGLAGHTYIS